MCCRPTPEVVALHRDLISGGARAPTEFLSVRSKSVYLVLRTVRKKNIFFIQSIAGNSLVYSGRLPRCWRLRLGSNIDWCVLRAFFFCLLPSPKLRKRKLAKFGEYQGGRRADHLYVTTSIMLSEGRRGINFPRVDLESIGLTIIITNH